MGGGHNLALLLRKTIERELPHLETLTEEGADLPRGPGKWRPKEELGHLIDSAANNHIRFARGAVEDEFHGEGYAQEDWVRLHGYSGMPWRSIVSFWFQYNQLLAALIARIPPERLGTKCFIGSGPAVTLEFVIQDYVAHMQHHLDQLLRREVVTPYSQLI